MSILIGDSGKVGLGPLKTMNITMANPREDNVTINPSASYFSNNLPTTQNASIGATYTIQQSDLPLVDAMSVKYTAFIVVSGKNTNASSQNVITQGFKNGSSVGTTTTLSVPTNQVWAQTYYRFFDVVVGDILNVQIWAGGSNVTFDYMALMVFPSRIFPNRQGSVLNNVTFSNFQGTTSLVAGNPDGTTMSGSINNQAYYVMITGANTYSIITSGTQTFPYLQIESVGLLRANNGDLTNGVYTNANATVRNYAKLAVPQTITYRELLR